MKTCPPTMSAKACLIKTTAVHFSIKRKKTNRCELYTIVTSKLKPYDCVKRQRVSRYGLKHFHWKSSGVLPIDVKKQTLALAHGVDLLKLHSHTKVIKRI